MGLREIVITACAAAALALPACRYQNMNAVNADGLTAPFYDLECHFESSSDDGFEQDVAFSFTPYGCSCNPRMSYAVGTGEGQELERRFELDFELSAAGDTHVHATSTYMGGPQQIFMYARSDPGATMQELPMQGGSAEEQVIRERMIEMWDGLWPMFYDETISGGGPVMDRMFRVCVEDGISSQADVISEEVFFIRETY